MSHDLHQRSRSDSPSLHSRAECYGFVGFVNDFPRLDRQMSIQRKNTMGHLEAGGYEIIQEKLQQLDARLCGVEQSNQTVAASSQIHRTSATAVDSTAGNMLPGEVSKMVEAAMQAAVRDLIERIAVLETQVLVQENDVMAGPHPTGGNLSQHAFTGPPDSSKVEDVNANEANHASAQESDIAQDEAHKMSNDSVDSKVPAPDTNDGHEAAAEGCEQGNPMWEYHRDYVFDESVYDALFFAFAQQVSTATSLSIIIAFVVNLLLQAGTVLVLSQNFIDRPLPNEDLDSLDAWRRSEGHAYYNADTVSGVSLVARVCGSDAGLSMAASQVGIIGDANEFLDTLIFEAVHLGPFLCNIALILWIFTCASEFRISLQFMLAVVHVPRVTGGYEWGSKIKRSKLELDGGELTVKEIAFHRMLIGLIVGICRASLAVLLLIYGSWWLTYTTSVRDLLLNASALGFVLDIDEIVFHVLSPSHMLGLIDSVQPLKVPFSKYGSFAIPCISALCIISALVIFNLNDVDWTFTRLSDAHSILCSDRLDFIYGISDMGRLFYGPSVPFHEPASALTTARRDAIQYIINKDPEAANYGEFKVGAETIETPKLVEMFSTKSTADVARDGVCVDDNGVAIGRRLWTATGNASLRTVERCEQVKTHCTGPDYSVLAVNVRFICPITCGCADPLAGMWYLAAHRYGCPWSSCMYVLQDALAGRDTTVTYGCQDLSLPQLQEQTGWSRMLLVMNADGLLSDSQLSDFQNRGCEAFLDLPDEDRRFLCSRFNIFADKVSQDDSVVLGAGVMCPESCGCYHDYDGVRKAYTPGDSALCPLASCWARYYASALEYYSQGEGGDPAEADTNG